MATQALEISQGTRMPQVTPDSIQETVQSIALLQGMVRNILVRGIDYGRIPGTPQDSLWDPGAAEIIAGFNCYCGQRRILKLEDDDSKIVVCIEVPIISRKLQIEVGSGVGAASTLETKYKYRWVANPREWGYDDAATATFKTKKGREDGRETALYRIPNPEHSELLNTIIKMASKRAEVDAAEGLPGVASVLREMFAGKPPRHISQDETASPHWQRFWGEVTRLGFTQQEAYQKLGVTTMHQWMEHHTLDEAITKLRHDGAIEQQEPPRDTQAWPQESDQDYEELFDDAKVEAPIEKPWLKESLKVLRNSGWDVVTHIKTNYPNAKGKTVTDAVDSLTPEQRQEFVKEVQKRLEGSKKLQNPSIH